MRCAVLLILLLAAAVFSGCDDVESPPPSAEPESRKTPLLTPFEGGWFFDLDQTISLWQAEGMPKAQVNQARNLARHFPLHPDIDLSDDSIGLQDDLDGEYLLFALHEHDQWICGKTWHHEDRHDPGDMTKGYVRLKIVDGNLHLSLRMQESWPDLNDPELVDMPLTAGSATNCSAYTAPEPDWSPWTTYVFSREPIEDS